MNVFQLKIKKDNRYQTEADQIYAFLDTYMGQPGLVEIGDFLENDLYNEIVGKFTREVFKEYEADSSCIYGLVIFEDECGNFLECLHTCKKGSEAVLRWAR